MTIINHSHRFVFVHIPKNAGTSVAHYLSQLSSYRDQEIGATELGEAIAPAFRRRFRLDKHSTFAEIEEWTGADIADYRSVAVVRDPADRVRSIYAFLRKWPGWTDLDPAYARFGAEFASFESVDAFIGSDLFLMPGPDRLFLPQATWLSSGDGERVAVDHLVRFESLEADLSKVVADLGLPLEALTQSLPRANVSNSRSSGRALTEASLSRVHARYRLDYELLGPFPSRLGSVYLPVTELLPSGSDAPLDSKQPSTPRHSQWPFAAILALVGLIAFTLAMVLSADLFVFSEARSYLIRPFIDRDLAQFFLFPEPNWGVAGMTTMAWFEGTGGFCGIDHRCVNAAGALLIAMGAVVATIHARQILAGVGASIWVSALWLLSPTVLALTMWHSARFDILAFVFAVSTLSLWWWALGRPHLQSLGSGLFVGASLLLLALSFNAKEITFFLPGALVILAVARGRRIGAVRRNLALAVGPVLYSGFFIAYALTHISPGTESNNSFSYIPQNLEQLLFEGAGLHRGFMGIWHDGQAIGQLHGVVAAGLLLVLGIGVAAAVLALRHGRVRLDRGAIFDWGPELYLLAIIGFTMLVNARSGGASVYYLPIPYFMGLLLGVRLLRRISTSIPRGRLVAGLLAVLFSATMALAYVGLLSAGSGWRTLQTASDQLHDLGATTRALLSGEPVDRVTWRTLELPDGYRYTLRGNDATTVTTEMWPWLMLDWDARPEVEEVAGVSVAELRADVSGYDEPGEVVLVIDRDYGLRFLAQGGEILLDRGDLAESL